ncbi:MAG: 23S rRNA (adenine(2503)-C(2))-methyltransferase RlmN [Myxococcota bacterium]
MINLYALDQTQLGDLMAGWGQPRFRTKQLWTWMYEHGATSFEEMTSLPKALRERLTENTVLGFLSVDTEQQSADGTVKRLYRLPDGQLIESVLMKYDDRRRTACISSQAGCAMGCAFCATGQMGFARHLTADEIFEQAQRFSAELRAAGERLSNVVLMGMGEPFHNYDAALAAIRRLMQDLGIGARHITVSTVGLAPRIRQFALEGLQVKLAISLHATEDPVRSKMMPINRRYDIAELIDACHTYVEKTSRRITFEWALIAGKNDTIEEARRLGRLLKGLRCHVNLIPLNPTTGYTGQPTPPAQVAAFVQTLAGFGVPATVRVRRGIDIDAGCGQLKSTVLNKQRPG